MRFLCALTIAVVVATSASAQDQGFFGSLGLGQLGTAKPPVSGPVKPPAGIQKSNSMGQPVVPEASAIVSPQAPQAVTEIRPDLTTIDADVAKSQVFGAHLFTGAFARQGPTVFNPDYAIAIGDSIRLRLWGSVTFDDVL